MNKSNTIKGFSIIEILVVLSIISVLAIVAIPNYRKHTGRVRMLDLLKLAEKYKTNMVYVFDVNSSFPSDGSRIISGATLDSGEYVLSLDFGNDIDQVAYRRISSNSAYIRVRFNTTTAPLTYQGISLYYGAKYTAGKLEFVCGDYSPGFQANLVRDELPVKCRTDLSTFLAP